MHQFCLMSFDLGCRPSNAFTTGSQRGLCLLSIFRVWNMKRFRSTEVPTWRRDTLKVRGPAFEEPSCIHLSMVLFPSGFLKLFFTAKPAQVELTFAILDQAQRRGPSSASRENRYPNSFSLAKPVIGRVVDHALPCDPRLKLKRIFPLCSLNRVSDFELFREIEGQRGGISRKTAAGAAKLRQVASGRPGPTEPNTICAGCFGISLLGRVSGYVPNAWAGSACKLARSLSIHDHFP